MNPGFPRPEWREGLIARGAQPAFADARAALDARVDGYHRVLPDIPSRQAGYYHDFFCPEHAVQLVFDPRVGQHHACPVDGRVFSGEPFDSAWGWSVNDALSDAALRAAIRYALDGGTGYRATSDVGLVRHVLTGYAERYRTLPPAPMAYPGEYTGVACWSALDESVWIIRLAWAAALVAPTLSGEQTDAIERGLFEPAAEHLGRVRYRQIQNVASWDNSANLTLALILGKPARIEELLHGEFGVRDQLARGVGSDGLWWEGSLSYHYYVLGALSWTIRGLRAAGRPFEDDAIVRSMFRAPLDLAFPDGSLPAMNDCWYHIGLTREVGHGIPDAAGFYEMAYGWYGDADFGWVVRENLRHRPRFALEAILDGAPELPAGRRPRRASRRFSAAGIAVLRGPSRGLRPAPDQSPGARAVRVDRRIVGILKTGSDGDAHGHPDQVGVQLFAEGRRLAIDPGTPGYGIPLNDRWYRQTASHSSLLIEGRSQPPATGRITRFERVGAGWLAMAEASWPAGSEFEAVVERARVVSWPDVPSEAYAGVSMRRSLLVTRDYVLDVAEVDAPARRAIDWLWHERGVLAAAVGLVAAPGALVGPCGYDVLSDVCEVASRPGQPLTWLFDDARVDAWFAPIRRERVFVASAPGNPAADRHDLVVRRVAARRAVFATVIAPSGVQRRLKRVDWSGSGSPYRLAIDVGGETQRWLIDRSGIRLVPSRSQRQVRDREIP